MPNRNYSAFPEHKAVSASHGASAPSPGSRGGSAMKKTIKYKCPSWGKLPGKASVPRPQGIPKVRIYAKSTGV